MAKIHPTAVVDPAAELAADVEVGPGAIVGGPGCVIGAGCVIGPHAQVGPHTVLGRNNRLYHGAIVGSDPQDLKFKGEVTTLTVGDGNLFREYCTINRGTGSGGGSTTIGNECLFMVYSHVAHDCHVGSRVIMANSATLAGHITVDDHASIGGLTPVHQFVRIGTFAFIGGGGWISMDVPPFMLVGGPDSRIMGINNVG
nr:acyl-ACP--UDP-N-acetylglucosamine O-acyltransferase [bacterium]